MLELIHVNKTYKNGVVGIKSVSIKINPGEIVGLIGENGSGKTILMKCISKSLFPNSGEILIEDSNIFDSDNSLNRVGILTGTVFYNHLTVYENVKYFIDIHNYKISDEEIESMLDFLNLKSKKNDKAHSLSYGMQQKLSLSLSLLIKPKLLILDEPFVGLDQKGIKELRKILEDLKDNKNTAILVSSHRLEELELLCSRFLLIKEGSIIFDGAISENEVKDIILNKMYNGDSLKLKEYEGSSIISTTCKGEELNSIIKELLENYKIYDIQNRQDTLSSCFNKSEDK